MSHLRSAPVIGPIHSTTRLYLVFGLLFLLMHFTGLLVFKLPYLLNAVVTSGVVLSALVLLHRWCFGLSFKDTITMTGLKPTRWKTLLPGLLIAGLLLLVYPLLGHLLQLPLVLTEDWLLNLTGLCLTGGVMEETVFRGFLFNGLRRTRGFRKAAIESLICFTLAHLLLFLYLDWPIALMSTLLAAGLSIPLAYLFERADHTIWSAALVHTIIRTIGLVVTKSEKQYMAFALAWILACLLIPYLVLFFDKNFRLIWMSGRSGAPPLLR